MHFSHHLRALLVAATVAVPLFALPSADAQFRIAINIGVPPPELPVYVQPPIPGDGYIWTPGYWAYGDAGYFWVPGTWVLAPEPGYLWTPGYWGYDDGLYDWHEGYWGPNVGYYGGVNYGFGYGGVGFYGGEWRGDHFFYNGAVANFGGWHPDHVYVDRDVVVHNTIVNPNHVSFNGPGGIDRRPSPDEVRFTNERHIQPTSNQVQHQNFAAQDRSQLAAVNHGRPATVAAANPAAYHQVAQQHATAQPISAADRSAGKTYNANGRGASNPSRPTNNFGGASRPESAPRPETAPRNDAAPRMESAPRTTSAPRTEFAPRPEPAPRNASAPRSEPAPRSQPAPRTPPAPRSQPAPRGQPAPKAAQPGKPSKDR
jgi:hypothetical protein